MMPGITYMPVASITRSGLPPAEDAGSALPPPSRTAGSVIATMVFPSTVISKGPRVGFPAPSMISAFLISSR